MVAIKAHAVVADGGTITVSNLPFSAGESAEIIILVDNQQPLAFPLAGQPVLKYDQPFEPALPPEQWEAVG